MVTSGAGANACPPCMRRAIHVRYPHMSWSRHGPPPGRRGYHHGNLREALIRATLDLIAERGLSGFSFAEAARAAGVSSAAPYRHYRDRHALIADVAREGYGLFGAELERAWNNCRPAPPAAIMPTSHHPSAPYQKGEHRQAHRPVDDEAEHHQCNPGRSADFVEGSRDVHVRPAFVNVTSSNIGAFFVGVKPEADEPYLEPPEDASPPRPSPPR